MSLIEWPWHTGEQAEVAWLRVVQQVSGWLEQHSVSPRQAWVVVPQTSHLALFRRAWVSAIGGWLPRLGTAASVLSDTLAGMPDGADDEEAGHLTLDPVVDVLWMTRQLLRLPVGREWLKAQPAMATQGIEKAMGLAHEWLKIGLALQPDHQGAHLQRASDWLHGLDVSPQGHDLTGVGQRERWLAGLALQWAQEALPRLRERYQSVFELRPAAWVLLTVGQHTVPGSDAAWMQAVLAHAAGQGVPSCWMPAVWRASAEWPSQTPMAGLPTLTQAAHFNEEAMMAAAAVVDAVQRRRTANVAAPVAMITQDRALSRRVRVLLMSVEQSADMVIQDASGWTLSTTRAAAAVTSLLQAARLSARHDDVMDWLLHGWTAQPLADPALADLEARWARNGVWQPWLDTPADAADADATGSGEGHALWSWAREELAPLQALSRTPVSLADALGVLARVLQSCGTWQQLANDSAGVQVLATLRLSAATQTAGERLPAARLWHELSASHRVNLDGLHQWVSQCLGRVNFEPAMPQQDADVVFLPMGQAALRSFASVIMPGVDESQLGVAPPAGHLLGSTEQALGLPSPEDRLKSQWEAFALLSAQPDVKAFYRQSKDGEPCSPSPWLGRWWGTESSGKTSGNWRLASHWPLSNSALQVRQTVRDNLLQPSPALQAGAAPGGPDALFPRQLSPSAYQRLRDCPYRYFALDMLRLKPADDVQEGLPRHEYGNWLHEVLRRFHDEPLPAEQDRAGLERHWLHLAHDEAQRRGLWKEARRPFVALHEHGLPGMAKAYVHWYLEREQAGWWPWRLESSFQMACKVRQDDLTADLLLKGHLDRVDRRVTREHTHWSVIDYKTSRHQTLVSKVRNVQEETQLAFYGLLLHASLEEPCQEEQLEAMYLQLDTDAVKAVPHPEVLASAVRLLHGIRDDFGRILAGHPLKPLGEGALCDRCEARGLCRKDDRLPLPEGSAS